MEVAASIHAAVQQMRRGGSRMAQLQAANRLAELFEHTIVQAEPLPPIQAAFAAAGGIEAAVQLLQSATPALQCAAASLLGDVCVKNEECAAAVASAGGVSALLRLLQQDTQSAVQPDNQLFRLRAALAHTVATSPAAAWAAANAGGGQLAIELLRPALQQPEAHWWPMAHILAAIARLGEERAADLAERGAIEALVQLLLHPDGERCATPGPVINAQALLADRSDERSAAIADAGVVPALLPCLSSDDPVTQSDTVQLLARALIARPHLGAGVIAAGGDSQLRRLLGSSNVYVRRRAADALAALAEVEEVEAAAQPAGGGSSTTPATPSVAQPARPPRVCAAPGYGAATGLKRCGGCGSVPYCSAACSRAHWREHRAECRRLQAERAAAASGSTGQ